jgi:methionine--tRNA ligase beta chain
MELVSFSDFKKLDIVIGEIVEAIPVFGSTKLLKLTLDFGEEKRTIVAGLGDDYKSADLIGKQIPAIINLEPRVIKGIESQGMILAIDKGGVPVLLCPDSSVEKGLAVR